MTTFTLKELIFYMLCIMIIGFDFGQKSVSNSLLEQTENNDFYRIYESDIYYQNFKFNCSPYYLNLSLNSNFSTYQKLINFQCKQIGK